LTGDLSLHRITSENSAIGIMATTTEFRATPATQAQPKVKLLLVDDSPENLVSLEATLEGLGQELVLASSGMEALRRLLEDDFAAILLDVKMPEMDGFQTAELIRARKRSRHTPILFLTGYKNEEHLFRGYDLGAVDFLFKPIVPEILRSKVGVFVELSRNTALLERQAKFLSKAEQKFRSLLEAAPDAMIISSEDGRINLVNSQVEAMFGFRRDELIGRSILTLVPEWTGGSVAAPGSSGAGSAPRELRGWTRGQVEFPIEISVSPLQTEDGVLLISALRDITERRKADRALLESEAKLRLLVDNVTDYAIFMLDTDGYIVSWNAGAERIHGHRTEEIIGRHLSCFYPSPEVDQRDGQHDEHRSAQRLAAEQALKTAAAVGRFEAEAWRIRKDGSRFWASVVLTALMDQDNHLVGFLKVTRDITDRKKADEEIRGLNASLEQRVEERTEELVASNDALRQSNEDLNQFAYAASHDLQEPLRMVALFSQMLHSSYAGRLDPEADQYISYVVNGAQTMEQLLKDLLEYSQAGSKSEGPPQPVDCETIMEKVLLNLKVSIEQNGASITWSDLPTVPAHEVRMVQLLQNLVGNAIKYRGKEPPRIHISAHPRHTGWIFYVQDNGIGISPEYTQQIFGVFKRLHGHNYPGTGIGLAICQRIVERYGGRIWVESTLGEGSTFCFTLPAVAGQATGAGEAIGQGRSDWTH
jgi:PAS domain S-box-containing protein